jgi:ribosomal protein S20
MQTTFSLVDKAAQKGYIKRGTAARYKTRLHARVKIALGEVQA